MPRQTRSLSEQAVRRILSEVFAKHPNEDLTREDIVRLAKKSKKLPTEWVDAIRDRALSKAIGAILRSEKFTDDHGDELRRYHCYRRFVQDGDREVQKTFWRDIDTMNRAQMLTSLRDRYNHARDTMRQADAACDYWNKHVAPQLKEKPIQKRLFAEDE